MKIPQNVFNYFVLLGSILGVLVIYYLRGPLWSLLGLFRTTAAKKRALAQRRSNDGQPVRVRQTDIIQNMTPQERVKYVQAEELVAQGRILDAARVFEAIRFQRRAIDLLEANNYIDEACGVLLRLKAPFRAGVICERNKMPERAAQYYAMAGNFDKAAAIYMDLATKDFHYLSQAAEMFEKTSNHNGLLRVWAKNLNTEKIVRFCMEKKDFHFLFDYLRDPFLARSYFESLPEFELARHFENLELTPQMAQTALAWAWVYPKGSFLVHMLQWLRRNKDLAIKFWQSAPPELAQELLETLKVHGAHLGHDLVNDYVDVLKKLDQGDAAYDLCLASGDFGKACELLFDKKEYSSIRNLLFNLKLNNLLQDFDALQATTDGQAVKPETLEKFQALLRQIPPPEKSILAISGKQIPLVLGSDETLKIQAS